MRIKRLILTLLVAALAASMVGPVSAAQIILEEVSLKTSNPYSNLFEINLDASGNLVVSDVYGMIWNINPLTGAYTYYDLGFGPATDAHRSGNRYFFTDNINQIGYADIIGGKSYVWNYDASFRETYKFGALAIDALGGVWIADYYGPEITSEYHKGGSIYQFKFPPSDTPQLCPMVASSGESYTTYAYDLVEQEGFLWYYNYFEDKIYRFNPLPIAANKYELKSWTTGLSESVIEGRVLSFDSSGLLWIPGGAAGTVMSFDPDSQKLVTYKIPVGSPSVEGVTVIGNQVWYADFFGSAGLLVNPLLADHSESSLTETTIYLSQQCFLLGTGASANFAGTKSDTLTFTERAVTSDSSHPGWTIYPLSSDDELNGINAAQGAIFITDTWLGDSVQSSRLLRFRLGSYPLYLPVILK